jgi:hypothetical protein
MDMSERLLRVPLHFIHQIGVEVVIYHRVPSISKLLNLATVFVIFITVTKHTGVTDPQCHSGTAPQNLTVHMTADVSHIQLVEIFHKSFVLLLASTCSCY